MPTNILSEGLEKKLPDQKLSMQRLFAVLYKILMYMKSVTSGGYNLLTAHLYVMKGNLPIICYHS